VTINLGVNSKLEPDQKYDLLITIAFSRVSTAPSGPSSAWDRITGAVREAGSSASVRQQSRLNGSWNSEGTAIVFPQGVSEIIFETSTGTSQTVNAQVMGQARTITTTGNTITMTGTAFNNTAAGSLHTTEAAIVFRYNGRYYRATDSTIHFGPVGVEPSVVVNPVAPRHPDCTDDCANPCPTEH
jgi:hypothetical protein